MNSIWRERLRLPALVVVTLAGAALALMVGYSIPSQPMLVMLTVVGLFVTVAALVNPILLPLLAMPLIVVVQRFGVGALE